jgi:DNA-binding Lrp family transcriptional regulator
MKEIIDSKKEVLKILLKDFTAVHTITSLAEKLKMTRVGMWKLLKKIESEKIIRLISIGNGKTSTCTITLNWKNPLTEKNLALILSEEAYKNERWKDNFQELENKVNFLIIYGSILTSAKDANDIDLMSAISEKKDYAGIDRIINSIQKTQIKKIHMINFSEKELKEELKANKALIDGVKKGIVLFGQENFIKFIRDIGGI